MNLMEHIRRSTARDFRLNVAALDQALEPSSDEEESEEEEVTLIIVHIFQQLLDHKPEIE